MATVVLVHGTTAGGWVWKHVAAHLRAVGHVVYTPTLTGLGERVHLAHPGIDLDLHITDVLKVLEFEELDQVILVGHSSAGMVITGVADRLPRRVARLVYLDALVPRDGDTAIDLLGPAVGSIRRRVETEGDGWLIPVQRGENEVPTHNVPHPFKTWTQPLKLGTAAEAIPRAYIRCTADKQPGQFITLALETSWQRARAAGWPSIEVNTVHQITADPAPKATALIDVLSMTSA